jgi:hypothetical protein
MFMQRKERKPHIELLLGDELQSLFSSGFNKDCLDPLGYDLRLGVGCWFEAVLWGAYRYEMPAGN